MCSLIFISISFCLIVLLGLFFLKEYIDDSNKVETSVEQEIVDIIKPPKHHVLSFCEGSKYQEPVYREYLNYFLNKKGYPLIRKGGYGAYYVEFYMKSCREYAKKKGWENEEI